jgi:DNA-binding MarR family transcriptional regulator
MLRRSHVISGPGPVSATGPPEGSVSEMLAIVHIGRQGESTPTRLAALLDLSARGITAMVQRLEAAGHVTRYPHPTDRRSCFVRLTAAAAELAARPDDLVRSEVEWALAELALKEQAVIAAFLEARQS